MNAGTPTVAILGMVYATAGTTGYVISSASPSNSFARYFDWCIATVTSFAMPVSATSPDA